MERADLVRKLFRSFLESDDNETHSQREYPNLHNLIRRRSRQ